MKKVMFVSFLFGCPLLLSGPCMVKRNVFTSRKPVNFVEESPGLVEFSKDGDSSASSGSQSVTALIREPFLPYAFFRESCGLLSHTSIFLQQGSFVQSNI